jgi:biopolymer transport protein ExbD/biopolymer transport protein TolR
MVPFIDIVLVLLIIFMITAPILQSSIEVDVPKTKTTHEINEQKIVVTMDKNQNVFLGNDPINVHIFLRCDKSVAFGAFASLMDALRQAGISNISIVTEPLPDRPKG